MAKGQGTGECGREEALIGHVESVIFWDASKSVLQKHPEWIRDIIQCGWKADSERFKTCLQHINCDQATVFESLGVKDLRTATRRRKASSTELGAPDKRALFVLISAIGKMAGETVMLQMSDGTWSDIHELVTVLQGSVADFLPVIILSAIEDPLEAPLVMPVARGRVDMQYDESSFLLLWTLMPMHHLWVDENGTVLVQLLGDILSTSGDARTIQEMLRRAEGVLEWYNSSRERLHKEQSVGWSSRGKEADGDEEEGEEEEGGTGGELNLSDLVNRRETDAGRKKMEGAEGGGERHAAASDGGEEEEEEERGGPLWAYFGGCLDSGVGYRVQLNRVAQPSFSPSGNTLLDNDGALIWHKQWQSYSVHTHQVKVTIVSQTPGATIYYTTDGTDPEPAVGTTHRYRKPVLLDYYGDGFADYAIRAVAIKEGLPRSRTSSSDVYRIQGQVKAVTFKDVRSDDSVLLSMSCATPGATIYFDDAGRVPTLDSPVYASPVRLHSKLVKAFATAPGQTNSVVSIFELLDQVSPPEVDIAGDQVLTSSLEEMSDGDDHAEEDKEEGGGGGKAVRQRGGKKNKGRRYHVFLDAATVQVKSQSGGSPGFKLLYTRDGTKPTLLAKRYTAPIHVDTAGKHSFTFLAIAHLMADSEIVEVSLIVENRVATPAVFPAPDTYKVATTVSCDCDTPGASLFLTVDGTEPLPPSHSTIAYAAPLHLNRRDPELFKPGAILARCSTSPFVPLIVHVRLLAVKRHHVDSQPAEARYRLLEVVHAPTSFPPPGLFSEYVDVVLNSETDGATIRYTMDGSAPDGEEASVYTGPIRVSEVGWTTIRAMAVKDDMWDSPPYTVRYGVEAQVLAWGYGRDGRLGNASEADWLKPVRVVGLLDHSIERVACGRAHTVLLDSQGTVLTCGSNLHGRLGHENHAALRPQPIPLPGNGTWKVTHVAAGERHTVLLTKNGAVFTFGDGNCGQLGHGDWEPCARARVVDKVTSGKRPDGKPTGIASVVKAIAAGAFHTLALSRDGLVWSWGRGGEGQLGNEERFSSCTPDRMAAKLVDGEEEGLYAKKVSAIAAGDWHSVMMLVDGAVYTCGRGIEGQLGYEDVTFMLLPGKIHSLEQPMIQIAAGRAHTLMLDKDGKVWACGSGEKGQCGAGRAGSILPQVIFENKDIAQIAAGPEYSVARVRSGEVWVWGRGEGGQLGLGGTEDVGTPTRLVALEGFSVKEVAAGEKHMVAVISKEHLLIPPCIDAEVAANELRARRRSSLVVDAGAEGRTEEGGAASKEGGSKSTKEGGSKSTIPIPVAARLGRHRSSLAGDAKAVVAPPRTSSGGKSDACNTKARRER